MQQTKKTKLSVLFVLMGICASSHAETDPNIVGSWEGMRDKNGECQFLSWHSKFNGNGTFFISFFSDEQRKQHIQTEYGKWNTSNGQITLRTLGVKTPEIYNYTLIDKNTIHYVEVVKDQTADCQTDYQYTEQRIHP